jgi:formate dehydrogenase maturation protein FdhE
MVPIYKTAHELLLEIQYRTTVRYGKIGYKFGQICPVCGRNHGDSDFQFFQDEKGQQYIRCPETNVRVYCIYA